MAGSLCLAVAIAVALVLDQRREAPDLSRISRQVELLEQARIRLEALPPVRPIHWQMRQLRLLAQASPGVRDMKAIEADPALYPQALEEKIGHFGGAVWKVAVQGSFTSVIWLCRTAQPLMHLVVDSIQATGDHAHAVLFVLGAEPVATGAT